MTERDSSGAERDVVGANGAPAATAGRSPSSREDTGD
jgi:hypothetical protein